MTKLSKCPAAQSSETDLIARKEYRRLQPNVQKKARITFLLTCSMAGHFGIRPLFEAINKTYACENKDVYEAVVQSFMELFVERPLGQVSRIWWRYEVQTSQSNLAHIHYLLWVNELKSSESFQNRVVLKKCQLLLS